MDKIIIYIHNKDKKEFLGKLISEKMCQFNKNNYTAISMEVNDYHSCKIILDKCGAKIGEYPSYYLLNNIKRICIISNDQIIYNKRVKKLHAVIYRSNHIICQPEIVVFSWTSTKKSIFSKLKK